MARGNYFEKSVITKMVKVCPDTECWMWLGTMTSNGYGQVSIRGVRYRPHRVSAHLWMGFNLESKLVVCHKCDNKACCNPAHLFIGTQSENMIDCRNKGRLRGEFKKGHKTNVGKHYVRGRKRSYKKTGDGIVSQ